MFMFRFGKSETRQCPRCGYKVSPPYPLLCPRCNEIIEKVVSSVTLVVEPSTDKKQEAPPIGIAPPTASFAKTIAKKIEQPAAAIDEETEVSRAPKTPATVLSQDGDYLKMMGVINTQSREIVFCSNDEYQYVLELGANAQEIANSILGGNLERILLEPSKGQKLVSLKDGQAVQNPFTFEEAIFQMSGSLLFCIYGVFFKRPAVLLQELKRLMIDIFKGQIKISITPMERSEIERRKNSVTAYIVHEYQKIRDTALRQASIPTMETQVKLHYIGLSYQSIGTLALLITQEGPDALPIKDISFGGDTKDGNFQDLVESLVSAKIEAIAANTLAQTRSFPRYIITKIGFDQYRVIEFFQLKNDYFLQILASGNVEILENVIHDIILPIVTSITENPFTGMLTTHNEVKVQLRDKLSNAYLYELKT